MDRATRKATPIKQATTNNEPSKTKQEGRLDADVNRIVATYGRTGMWANVSPRQPTYGDVSAMLELEQALELVNHARREFMTLPAHVRALAENDPAKLLGMLANPAEVEVLKAAGLPLKEAVTAPVTGGGGDTHGRGGRGIKTCPCEYPWWVSLSLLHYKEG